MPNNESKYFDLHTTGIGYLNRVREVTPKEGKPFLSITLSALRGSVDNAQYTHFECHVSGKQAQETVRLLVCFNRMSRARKRCSLDLCSVISMRNPSSTRKVTKLVNPVSASRPDYSVCPGQRLMVNPFTKRRNMLNK